MDVFTKLPPAWTTSFAASHFSRCDNTGASIMTFRMVFSPIAVRTARISCSARIRLPSLNQPIFMTMSISVAPSLIAPAASAALSLDV